MCFFLQEDCAADNPSMILFMDYCVAKTKTANQIVSIVVIDSRES